MTSHKSSSTGDNNPQPPPPNTDGDSAPCFTKSIYLRTRNLLPARQTCRKRSTNCRTSFRGANTGQRGLKDEEGGTNQNADKNKQKPLLSEEIVDGSGERSGVFESFWGIWRCRSRRNLFIPPVIDAGLLMELFDALHCCVMGCLRLIHRSFWMLSQIKKNSGIGNLVVKIWRNLDVKLEVLWILRSNLNHWGPERSPEIPNWNGLKGLVIVILFNALNQYFNF